MLFAEVLRLDRREQSEYQVCRPVKALWLVGLRPFGTQILVAALNCIFSCPPIRTKVADFGRRHRQVGGSKEVISFPTGRVSADGDLIRISCYRRPACLATSVVVPNVSVFRLARKKRQTSQG